MTIGDAMVQLVITFYGTFAVVAVVGIALGMALGWWLRSARPGRGRVGVQAPAGLRADRQEWLEPLMDGPVFETGVAKVGDR